MFGFDDAANMALGVANAGVQIYGARTQARHQRQMQALNEAMAKRQHDYDIKNIGLDQEDVNRQAALTQQASREDAFDRGMGNSGQRDYNRGQIEGERGRRFDALGRQMTKMNADWLDQQKLWEIQKRMQKNAQTMSMISSMLLQGGGGAGAALGG